MLSVLVAAQKMTYTVNWFFAGTALGITVVSGIALLAMRRASKRPHDAKRSRGILSLVVGIVFWVAAFVAFLAVTVIVQILIDPHTAPTLGN